MLPLPPSARRTVLRALFLVLFLAAAGWIFRRNGLSSCDGMEGRIAEWGSLGWALFVAASAVGTVLFVPGTLIAVAGGVAFPTVVAVGLVFAGSLLGAVLAFLAARHVFPAWVRERLERYRWYATLSARFAERPTGYLLFLRFSPIFPFNALNYACALLPVSTGAFAITTAVGILPGTLVYVWMGRVFGCSVWQAGGGRRQTLALLAGLTLLSFLPLLLAKRSRRGPSLNDEKRGLP